MLAQARELQNDKYQTLKNQSRRGEELINLDFVRDLMRVKGWRSRKVLGKKKIVQPELVEKADVEIAIALEGFADHEIANFDESKLALNYAGDQSLQPPEGLGGRSINMLDDKRFLTICHIIKKDGTMDFYPTFVDSHIHVLNDRLKPYKQRDLSRFQLK